jgi:hypothetical protein
VSHGSVERKREKEGERKREREEERGADCNGYYFACMRCRDVAELPSVFQTLVFAAFYAKEIKLFSYPFLSLFLPPYLPSPPLSLSLSFFLSFLSMSKK